jgi:hypothetical protein
MKEDLEQFIARNREQFDHHVPPPQVLGRVLQRMQPEEQNRPAGIVISFRSIRWAAACITVVMMTTVLILWQKEKESTFVIDRIKPPAVQQVPDKAAQTEDCSPGGSLGAVDRDLLRRKEAVQEKFKVSEAKPRRQVRLASLSDMDSPAKRITAANAAEKLSGLGKDVIDALVSTLNTDPNSNVRLAALDGLAKFYQEDYVRKQLLKALKKQHDPVIQVAMINLLVRMRVSGILEQLGRMVKDDNYSRDVKDCAYSGLLELKAI